MNAHMIVMATSGHQALTTGLFLAVVALTVGITFWASRTDQSATGRLLRRRPRLQRLPERPRHRR